MIAPGRGLNFCRFVNFSTTVKKNSQHGTWTLDTLHNHIALFYRKIDMALSSRRMDMVL
jgi:hypothetical protein